MKSSSHSPPLDWSKPQTLNSVMQRGLKQNSASVESTILWCLYAAITLVFFATEYAVLIRPEDYSVDGIDLKEQSTADGTPMRRIMFVLLGVIGYYCWTIAPQRPRQVSLLGICMLALLGWSLLSLTWAHDFGITARRMFVLILFVIGGWGITQRLTFSQLLCTAICVTATFWGVSFFLELINGMFQPWSGEYRFAGCLHPNQQGLNCTMLVLASWYLSKNPEFAKHKRLLLTLAVIGFVFLFLTRSRSAFGAFVFAIALSWLLRAEFRTKLVWIAYTVTIGSVAIIVLSSALGDTISQVMMMGRDDQELTGSLTGRVPLWDELWFHYLQDRWLLGYGFHGFWLPEHIDEISATQSWAISEAHNAYFDMLLGLGIVGAALYVVVLILGIGVCAYRDRRAPNLGYGFGTTFLLVCLFNGLLESSVAVPRFVSFMAGCVLIYAAFFRLPEPEELSKKQTSANDGSSEETVWGALS